MTPTSIAVLLCIVAVIAKMLTNGGVAEYQIKSRKMRYPSLGELYKQRDLEEIGFAGRLRIRIARRKNRAGIGGQTDNSERS